MKKFFRRALTAIFVVAFMISASVACAEVKNYTGVGEYYMSDFETPEIAKQRAKQRAEQDACEQAGVFVKSFSRTKNAKLDEDVIETMTSGILKIVDVQYHRENSDDTTLFRVTIQAQIDDSDITKWLKKDSQEISTLVSQNEALRKSNEELARQIEELKKKIPQAKTEADKERITQEFAAEDKKFLSNQKVDEAWKFYGQKDFNGAKNLFDEAINLNPDNAQAWFGRGTAYGSMKKYEQSIQDFDRAIELMPNFTNAYFCRGGSYYLMKNFNQAIADATKTIQLNPNLANAYKFRGICFQKLGENAKAQADFAKAKELGYNG